MDRKQQQVNLLMKLGALLAPLEEVSNHPERFDPQARAQMLAKYFAGQHYFTDDVSAFCRGEPGHEYRIQSNQVSNALGRLAYDVEGGPDDDEKIRKAVALAKSVAGTALATIPVSIGNTILEANSPFTAYCKLKDICCAVLQTLLWTDRYFDAGVFHRYVRDVRLSATVTLVIVDPAKINSAKNKTRFNEFMDVSRLFATERGPDHYQLVAHLDFHDRWLRCDGQLYALGGSVKDAGQKADFAIGRIDPSPQNIARVDDLVRAGRALFGPANPIHP